jgi:hypothetical protein
MVGILNRWYLVVVFASNLRVVKVFNQRHRVNSNLAFIGKRYLASAILRYILPDGQKWLFVFRLKVSYWRYPVQ